MQKYIKYSTCMGDTSKEHGICLFVYANGPPRLQNLAMNRKGNLVPRIMAGKKGMIIRVTCSLSFPKSQFSTSLVSTTSFSGKTDRTVL